MGNPAYTRKREPSVKQSDIHSAPAWRSGNIRSLQEAEADAETFGYLPPAPPVFEPPTFLRQEAETDAGDFGYLPPAPPVFEPPAFLRQKAEANVGDFGYLPPAPPVFEPPAFLRQKAEADVGDFGYLPPAPPVFEPPAFLRQKAETDAGQVIPPQENPVELDSSGFLAFTPDDYQPAEELTDEERLEMGFDLVKKSPMKERFPLPEMPVPELGNANEEVKLSRRQQKIWDRCMREGAKNRAKTKVDRSQYSEEEQQLMAMGLPPRIHYQPQPGIHHPDYGYLPALPVMYDNGRMLEQMQRERAQQEKAKRRARHAVNTQKNIARRQRRAEREAEKEKQLKKQANLESLMRFHEQLGPDSYFGVPRPVAQPAPRRNWFGRMVDHVRSWFAG